MSRQQNSCCLLGSTSLLIRCARTLLERGWTIRFVITEDARVAEWCRNNDIAFYETGSDLASLLKLQKCNHLFSIVNSRILTSGELSLVDYNAYNYHDGPLPEYAGMHAAFWALFNGEQEHGITWHKIDTGIDTGSILVQNKFPVSDEETTLSLNTKCYQQAAAGFELLIEDLESESTVSMEQRHQDRSYFSSWKRPDHACLLDLDQVAERIHRLYRALDHGVDYENPIGSPKVWWKGELFIVEGLEILKNAASGPPASILGYDKGLVVNTRDLQMRITALRTIYGELVPQNDLKQMADKADGSLLIPACEFLENSSELYERFSRKEKKWVDLLSGLDPVEIPYHCATAVRHQELGREVNSIPFPSTIPGILGSTGAIEDANNWLALAALYMVRLTARYSFDIWIRQLKYDAYGLFSDRIPVRISIKPDDSLADAFNNAVAHLTDTIGSGSFCRDILYRHPVLRECREVDELKHQNFMLDVCLDPESYQTPENVDWVLVCCPVRGRFYLHHPVNDAQAAGSFMSHLEWFLNSLPNIQRLKLSEIPLMSEQEVTQLLEQGRGETIRNTPAQCVHKVIEAIAVRSPSEVAVVFNEAQLTYKELNSHSSGIASVLLGGGVKIGSRVGIYLERSHWSIVAILGILKAGALYLPIHRDHPSKRIHHIMEDSGMSKVISSKSLDLPECFHDIEVLYLEDMHLESAEPTPGIDPGLDALAYIMYTSGSTGPPKGVPVSHRNVAAFITGFGQLLSLKKRRIGTTASPFSFDVSVEEVFSTLCSGGTLHVIPKDLLMAPNRLASYLFKHQVTVAYIIPNLLERLADAFTSETIVHLECLLTGIHAKRNRVLKAFNNKSPHLRIINTYGPTETTYGASGYCYKGSEQDDADTPIGLPFPGYSLYVTDAHHRLVPNGVVGELLIGGVGVTKGYLNWDERSMEKFFPLPFNPWTNVYASGDLVYRDQEGILHFIERKDNQVKISGNRVETGEVEEAISCMEEVDNVVVVAQKVHQQHLQLAAYIVFRAGRTVDPFVISARLSELLPAYAIPSYFIALDMLPVFPNGKVNFNKLPEVRSLLPARHVEPPENEIEQKLLIAWKKALQTDVFGVEDHFFRNGGDSLTAVDMITDLESSYGIRISISMLYALPTIRSLAAVIRSGNEPEAMSHIVKYSEGNVHVPFYMIHGQNGSVAFLNDILESLQCKSSIYSIQAGVDYNEIPSMEVLAEGYAREILQTGHRNCILCGFSFGGILAFEIAKILHREGIRVGLIMLDSKPNRMLRRMRPILYRHIYGMKVLKWLMKGYGNSDEGTGWERFRQRIIKLFLRLKYDRQGMPVEDPEVSTNLYKRFGRHSKKLILNYRPEVYEGDMLLIKARKQHAEFIGADFPRNLWRYFIRGRIDTVSLDLHHFDFGSAEFAPCVARTIDEYYGEFQDSDEQ